MASRAFKMGMPSRKWLAIAALLVLLAVAIGTLLALGTTRGFQTGAKPPAAGSEVPTAPVGPLPPPVGRAAPRVVMPRPAPVVPPMPRAVASAPAVDEEDADRIAGAIERTTRKALRRGETVHWHKAGQEGYVSVGDPLDDGDRQCRNVTAVILSDNGLTQSSTHLWCTDADDDDGDDWTAVR